MKLLGLAFLMFVLPAAASAQQSPGNADIDREIRRQSERYFDAVERRDVKSLDRLLLDNCVICYAWGPGDTKAALRKELSKPLPVAKQAAAAKPVADAKPAQRGYTLSDVNLRHAGDTAILAAVMTRKGLNEPGLINTHRRTLVWVRQQGHWRLLQDQWSLVGDGLFAQYWSIYFRGNDQNFKREPNSLLVKAVKGRQPGKALDACMGQGRNAIYLAKQGWKVTGFDRAEGALAVARQEAIKQKVRITPILQSVDEFDWGHAQWDLIAVLYAPAVRGNVTKIRESLRPGGLVVIEAFLLSHGETGGGTEYQPGELRKMFADGFKLLHYEEGEGIADYGQKRMQLVHLIASRL
jgi:ketosteroid isomerase-like protein